MIDLKARKHESLTPGGHLKIYDDSFTLSGDRSYDIDLLLNGNSRLTMVTKCYWAREFGLNQSISVPLDAIQRIAPTVEDFSLLPNKCFLHVKVDFSVPCEGMVVEGKDSARGIVDGDFPNNRAKVSSFSFFMRKTHFDRIINRINEAKRG